jgi:hypothetical protein
MMVMYGSRPLCFSSLNRPATTANVSADFARGFQLPSSVALNVYRSDKPSWPVRPVCSCTDIGKTTLNRSGPDCYSPWLAASRNGVGSDACPSAPFGGCTELCQMVTLVPLRCMTKVLRLLGALFSPVYKRSQHQARNSSLCNVPLTVSRICAGSSAYTETTCEFKQLAIFRASPYELLFFFSEN